MTWNYVVVRQATHVKVGPKKYRSVKYYDVYEVYRNKAGKIDGWSQDPINLQRNDSLRGLRFQFARIIADSYHFPIMEFKGRGKARTLVISKRQKDRE